MKTILDTKPVLSTFGNLHYKTEDELYELVQCKNNNTKKQKQELERG
jgi:uncharacterized protein YlbG (UPF0298 family)